MGPKNEVAFGVIENYGRADALEDDMFLGMIKAEGTYLYDTFGRTREREFKSHTI